MTTRHVDVDVLLAARSTEQNDPPTVTFLGEEFKLPVELPFAVVEALAIDDAGSAVAAARALLGDQYDHAVHDLGASAASIGFLYVAVLPLYGMADPEVSGASDGSSPSTSPRSTPTSDGSTGSTSQPRAGESSP